MSIIEKYSQEISDINYELNRLEQGRFTELSNANSDGLLANNVKKLKLDIAKLLSKIEHNSESINDEILKYFGINSEE